MAQVTIKVGPQDHGRVMSLDDFDHAEGQEGYLYELGRGRVVVMDVPKLSHGLQVQAARHQLEAYSIAHPGRIYYLAPGSDCKLLVEKLQSERHPDLTIYKQPPDDEEDPWSTWIPELVIKVVSPHSSETRDYEEKREEYLLFGVRECWILDAAKETMTVLQRVSGRWKPREVRPPEIYRPRLLPGLAFDCGTVFAAARSASK